MLRRGSDSRERIIYGQPASALRIRAVHGGRYCLDRKKAENILLVQRGERKQLRSSS